MKRNWKEFIIAALIRAIRTFAQTFIGCISVGAAFSEVQWLKGLSISGVAFILSLLTSVATGLPEVQDDVDPAVLKGMDPDPEDQPCPPMPKGEE